MRLLWMSHAGGMVLWLCLFALSAFGQGTEPPPDLEVFVREGCPHCATAKVFLAELQRERPSLRVIYRDVGADPAALARFEQLILDHGIAQAGVPAFSVRGHVMVGFRSAATTGARLIALLDTPPPQSESESPAACRVPSGADCLRPSTPEPDVVLPVIGRLSLREIGLPLFTLAVGLLDGFNPCAMWVLLFLLSLLVSLRDRMKMALVAGTFVLVSGLVYFAFMAAWLNIFLFVGLSRAVQLALGLVAVFIGSVHLKDFVAFKQGLSLTIPDSAKPGLYARMRSIVQAENLAAALIAIVTLAVLVNAVELLCTAGFPALYTEVLTMHQLPDWQYYSYLALYNVAYIFDDTLMVTIAVVTLGRRKLTEHEGRWLKLISGTVMIGLGLLLLLKPDLLSGG